MEEQSQDKEFQLFTQNLKEMNDDFNIMLPYAPYQKKFVSVNKNINRNIVATQFQLQNNTNQESAQLNSEDSCDLAFVLDCTGSMGSWIQRCKTQIINILNTLKQQFSNSTFRAGFVAYRDHCDTNRIEKFPFISSKYENLENFIGKLVATGGGDGPEDLAGGLFTAIHELSWISKTKNLFIIADAPCHGKKYHSTSDDYPEGCPKGINIEGLIETLAKRNIELSVLDINTSTNLMFSIFQDIYKKTCGKDIMRINLSGESNNVRYQESKEKSAVIAKTVLTSITGTTLGVEGGGISGQNEKKEKVNHAYDSIGELAIRVLRTHKGLLNTACLSHTELAYSVKTTAGGLKDKYDNKKNAICEQEEDEDEDEEHEEEKEDGGKRKLNHKEIEVKKEVRVIQEEVPNYTPEQLAFINYQPTSMVESTSWCTSISNKEAFTFSCICITAYVEKKKQIDWSNPTIKFQKLTSKIQIYKKYFSEGAMRFAFYAYDTILNQKLVAKLHKNWSDNSNFEVMKRDSMSLIACHYFADEFNSRMLLKTTDHDEVPILINFVDSSIYEVLRHYNKDIKYYFVENYIEGDYQKYNNNAGWTSSHESSQFNQISQAFSHFTWQYSQGQLLVVDIQGADLGVLTDPQIHTKNRSRLYGQGDLGYEGMLKFFHTHHCNEYCERLNLIHPILQGKFPKTFDFFSDFYGLEQYFQKKEIVQQNEIADEKPQESNDKKPKKQKKKRGFALLAEYEKEKQKQEEQEKILKQKQEEEEKLKQKQLDTFVGTQCALCKKCFFTRRNVMIQNKINKIDTMCETCQNLCEQSLLDLACIKCGNLFKISKYYCKAKKVNLIGTCVDCRE
ncbi:hypothetical protein ABPG72_008858 [Tetrahymena utriculariae]